jgi:hypothetical protein
MINITIAENGKNHSLRVEILFVFDSIQTAKYKIIHNFIISDG